MTIQISFAFVLVEDLSPVPKFAHDATSALLLLYDIQKIESRHMESLT